MAWDFQHLGAILRVLFVMCLGVYDVDPRHAHLPLGVLDFCLRIEIST